MLLMFMSLVRTRLWSFTRDVKVPMKGSFVQLFIDCIAKIAKNRSVASMLEFAGIIATFYTSAIKAIDCMCGHWCCSREWNHNKHVHLSKSSCQHVIFIYAGYFPSSFYTCVKNKCDRGENSLYNERRTDP